MDKPKIADKKSVLINLEPGTYYWCTCGKSSNQPYCDGSHIGSEFKPLVFNAVENKDVYLCQCKHTNNPPYCDGSHRKL